MHYCRILNNYIFLLFENLMQRRSVGVEKSITHRMKIFRLVRYLDSEKENCYSMSFSKSEKKKYFYVCVCESSAYCFFPWFPTFFFPSRIEIKIISGTLSQYKRSLHFFFYLFYVFATILTKETFSCKFRHWVFYFVLIFFSFHKKDSQKIQAVSFYS